MNTDNASDVIELASAYSFAETVTRLRSAIEGAGMRVFAEIDHAAGATSVGLEMPPTVVLIYGNPKGGTPLMVAAPLMALDLPLRVLVREDAEGHAQVAYHPAQSLTRAVGLADDLALGLAKAQTLIANAIRGANV